MSNIELLSVDQLEQVRHLLESLSTLTKTYQIYGLDHPSTDKHLEQYQSECESVLRLPGLPRRLVLAYHDGRFYLEHVPLPTSNKRGNIFETHLAVNEMGGFEISLDVRIEELEQTLKALTGKPARPGEELVETPTFRWIDADQLHRLESSAKVGTRRNHMILELAELRIDENLYIGGIRALDRFMEDCFEGRASDATAMNAVTKQLVSGFCGPGASNEALVSLTTVPYHDNFTYYHSLNVAILTLKAASLVVEDEHQLQRIGKAALLHDLGKVDVPKEILYKAGRLDEDEAKQVMAHPVTGARRIAAFPDADPLAVRVAFGHHIKDNGQGYPKVSSSYTVDPVTRLLEVVDIFEALTAFRPYQAALTASQAFEILYDMPNMESFRPYMDLLVRSIGFNPVGSRVRTADGELAIVTGHEDGDPRRPIVRAIAVDGSGETQLSSERTAQSVAGPDQLTDETSVVAVNPEEELCLA